MNSLDTHAAAFELLRALDLPNEGPGSDVLLARAENLARQFTADAERANADLAMFVGSVTRNAPEQVRRGLY